MKECKIKVLDDNNVQLVGKMTIAEAFSEFISHMEVVRDKIFDCCDIGCSDCFEDYAVEFTAFAIFHETFIKFLKEKNVCIADSVAEIDLIVKRCVGND